jgi:UTP--glucose-1-phosphate uridylyltransferase
MPVTKAVIPAAGFGTRFLPATKSVPKEMLPVVDTPTIQYVVEECVKSGITDILMVIGRGKRALEEHFYSSEELEKRLEDSGQVTLLENVRHISEMANIHFVWQKELNGLGDAVSHGRTFIGNDPFALLLGDTILRPTDSTKPILRQMMEVYETKKSSVVALEEVARDKVSRYGIAGGNGIADNIFALDQLVEKPSPEEAPSNLAVAARYIFQPEILDYLSKTPRGKNNEIQLTDAMAEMLKDHGMYGFRFAGKRYDIGNKLDFIKTNIELGLAHDDISGELAAYLKNIAAEL